MKISSHNKYLNVKKEKENLPERTTLLKESLTSFGLEVPTKKYLK
jgi:hypothetical protein